MRRSAGLPSGPELIVDAPTPEQDELLRGLASAGMEVVEIAPAPTPQASARRSAGAAVAIEQPMRLDVPLAPGEAAAVLLEQDGFYSWVTRPTHSAATPATVRRSGAPAATTVTFVIDIHPTETAASATRSLASFVFGRVRALVLRFLARAITGVLADRLERHVQPSLVRIGGSSITSWRNVDTLAGMGLDGKPSPRVLLFVHGTFSSTRGGFGALTAAPWGCALLDAAVEQYDAVIGYDHRTLSEDPKKNAEAMLAALRTVEWKGTPRFDVITHSRGGLVFRSMTEQFLPSSGFNATFKKAVFAGVPNAGTELARRENWNDLINLYTNGAAMLFRLIGGLAPAAAPIAAGFAEGITILGSLVKYLAEAATSDIVPGLEAQVPGGRFVKELNRGNAGQPTPATTFYTWIGSTFEAKAQSGMPQEMPSRLWKALADGFVDRLMKNAPNDLVIDVPSMASIDAATGGFLKDQITFGGANARVYHTNYFAQSETANALARWLQISVPQPAVTVTRVAPAPTLPAAVDTDILVVDSGESAEDLRVLIDEAVPSYVVRETATAAGTLHESFSAEEFSLGLRESMRVNRPLSLKPSKSNLRIVMHEGRPIGVVSDDDSPSDDLISLARVAGNPSSFEERVLAKRAMPTFAAPAATVADPGAAESPLYHFGAQMDAAVQVKKNATVEVTISREAIEIRDGATGATGSASIARDRALVLQIIPRKNFEVDGESRFELKPEELTETVTRYFDVIPTDQGDGELWIVARQGPAPLVTLVLKSTIVQQAEPRRKVVTAEARALEPEQTEEFDQLTVLELERGGKTLLHFELRAPSIGVLDYYDSKPIEGSREEYVLSIYKELESYWGRNADDARNFLEDVRSFGMGLFDKLVPEKLQALLWQQRDSLKSIMVVSTEPFLPWELLHLHAPGDVLPDEPLFLGQLGLVRWLYGTWPPATLRVHNGQARYVIPRYPVEKYVLKEAEKERAYLEATFAASPVTPQLNEVRELLGKPGGFDLLHYSCHGANDTHAADAQLMLQGRVVNGVYYPAMLKAVVVHSHGKFGNDGSRPLVVINACQVGESRASLTSLGGFAAAFIERGAGAFVAPLWSVGDHEATVFSGAFYDALRAGKTLSGAVIDAREKARTTETDASWIAYAVYGHPHARLVER